MVGMGVADDQGVDARPAIDFNDSFGADTGIDQYGPVSNHQEPVAVGKPAPPRALYQPDALDHRRHKWKLIKTLHVVYLQ